MKKLPLAQFLLAIVAAFLVTSPAQARWHKAESDHFVIYADDSARDVERFAQMLERYHQAMGLMLNRQSSKPAPSGRVTIFAVGSDRDMKRLTGGSQRIAGFYMPRASGSMAFVQDVRPTSSTLDFSMTILLHEYAHHYLMSSSSFAWPRWVNEGAAEFFASAQFPRDGGVKIGLGAQHRGYELVVINDVPIRELLSPESFPERDDDKHDSFYGRAWLLYHYLSLGSGREGQLRDYQLAIAAGATSLEAAERVFGDLDQLEDDLDGYLKQRQILSYDFGPEWFKPTPVSVVELSEGMGKVMPLMIRSKRGVDREEAAELLPEIRAVAAQFPNDAGVLEALAEAEYDAGNDAEAIAAADRALALDATAANALVQKGYALFRMAEDAAPEDEAAAYAAAMAPFSALNRLDNDHPLPLMYFYRSYVDRGQEPSELARHALERASQMAPFDHSLALNVATMLAQEGKVALSQAYLERIAANPHRNGLTELATAFLDQIEGREEGKSVTFGTMVLNDGFNPPPESDDDSEDEDEDEAGDQPAEPATPVA